HQGRSRSVEYRRSVALGSDRAFGDGDDALGFAPDGAREGLSPRPVQNSHVADQIGAHVRFLSRAHQGWVDADGSDRRDNVAAYRVSSLPPAATSGPHG